MSVTQHRTFDTPAGPLTVLTHDRDGTTVIVAAGFTDDPARLHDRLRDGRGLPLEAGDMPDIAAAVDAWLAGDHAAFDGCALDGGGTDFQRSVWDGLRAIGAGEVASYRDLAERVGRPSATRAVGSACGANMIAPMIPCHRALRTDGSLGGYEYGLDVKRWLLAHEEARTTEQAALPL